MTELSIFYAMLLGLLGSAHCLGMCGGISSAIAMGINRQNNHPLLLLFSFNTGRVLSYALAGGILGGLGWLIESPLPA
ncbi:sulfite exporter TauE/SafE family protein [Aliamphritea spongicola]|nr:sulfite exporter TauE/SafE family protein [Aliamphritea spongicola]